MNAGDFERVARREALEFRQASVNWRLLLPAMRLKIHPLSGHEPLKKGVRGISSGKRRNRHFIGRLLRGKNAGVSIGLGAVP